MAVEEEGTVARRAFPRILLDLSCANAICNLDRASSCSDGPFSICLDVLLMMPIVCHALFLVSTPVVFVLHDGNTMLVISPFGRSVDRTISV